MQEASVVLDDPLIYVAGDSVRAATIPATLYLTFELRALLLQLDSCIFMLLMQRP